MMTMKFAAALILSLTTLTCLANGVDIRVDFRTAATAPGGNWNSVDNPGSANLKDFVTGQTPGITLNVASGYGLDKAYTTQWNPAKTGPEWLDVNKRAAMDGLYEIGHDLTLTFSGLKTDGTTYVVEAIAAGDEDGNTIQRLIYKINNVPFDGSANGYWNAKTAYTDGTWMTWDGIQPNGLGKFVLTVGSYDTTYRGRDRVINAVRILENVRGTVITIR